MKAIACKPGRFWQLSMTRSRAPRVEQATAAVAAAKKKCPPPIPTSALADATLKRYQQLYERNPSALRNSTRSKPAANRQKRGATWPRAGAGAGTSRARAGATSLGYTQIRAPFAGVVTEKKADAGTLASPGMPLFTIEDTRSYRLEVDRG